ncbi:MAG TPA: hypothetical protein VKZ43_09205 [Trueperaceae bacterium]|nr:hypothetical protein [Trueperaceae bacterium]
MSLLDAGTVAWFVVAMALLLLQQFGAGVNTGAAKPSPPTSQALSGAGSRAARLARVVLVPLLVLLSLVFAWKIVTVFAPILGFDLP